MTKNSAAFSKKSSSYFCQCLRRGSFLHSSIIIIIIMNTVVLLLSCIVVVAVSTNPICDFSTIDTKGNIMIYNPSRFAVPSTETQLFVVGTDGSAQTQKIFLNVCGDASLVGCTSSTPICQKLSNTSYASFVSGTTFFPP